MIATSSAVTERTFPSTAAAPAPACTWPNAPNSTFPIERFIARPISIVSSVPDAPTSAPLTIRTFESQLEPCRRSGETCERVQERDHDRHVGPADRQHEQDAEDERAADDRDDQPLLLECATIAPPATTIAAKRAEVDELLAGIRDRPTLDQLLQFGERDHRAGERDRPDQRREHDREAHVAVEMPRLWGKIRETRRAKRAPLRLRRRR